MQTQAVVRRILVLGLLLLSALTIALAIRFQAVSRSYDILRQRSALPHAGYYMPTFTTRADNGDTIVIGMTSGTRHRQLVFVLTTTCPYCRQTLPIWSELADSARRLQGWKVDVLGISLDSAEATRQYGETQNLRFPLVTFPTRKLKQLYRARAVPQTLVLDDEGRVLYARTGLLEPQPVLDSVYHALQWTRSVPRQSASAETPSAIKSREPNP